MAQVEPNTTVLKPGTLTSGLLLYFTKIFVVLLSVTNPMLQFLILALFLGIPVLMLSYYLIYEPLRILMRFVYLNTDAKLYPEEIQCLENIFPFYKELSEDNKKRFERRVALFIHYKKIIGQDIEITNEMKVIIAASAIQLTFGLHNFWLTEFDIIRILGDSYYIEGIERKAMGDISPEKGIITLSWNNVMKGIADTGDGINVGLHEMAHALMISSTEKGWNMNFAMKYEKWEKEASIGWYEKKENAGFFRSYAYTNLYEFFAVAVEYFFEEPKQFSEKEPRLYNEMKELLRLDPTNALNPILSSLPHKFPSQKIPLPRYSIMDFWRMIIKGPFNIVFFFLGVGLTGYGVYMLLIALSLIGKYPESYKIFMSKKGGLTLACAFVFLLQVFYNPKKKQN